ncbi:ATP-dependent helicase HrpB [Colwellia sp. KU-HH00111]|uniref:ATP-dependent helicase HrpB n=1 Tax=Colwellia sp. KU-HH00111 TaxID=3127652 RepID=UPI0031080997
MSNIIINPSPKLIPEQAVLPIEAIKVKFCQALSKDNTLILSAPPGAGKSTCLPLWLLEQKVLTGKKIYLLQPRRLAVKNIACYLASQLNEPVGETVGYRLRNETKVSNSTRLEVITEGILTQIIQNDAELSDCGLVVFDEFHERSLHGDLAFALSRDVQLGLRDDLKILLMSATLDVEQLTKALPEAISLASEGRSFPVEISYNAPSVSQRWRDHALAVIKQQAGEHQGSILVFLPGVADIRFLAQTLSAYITEASINHLLLCPLYGDLTLKQQQQAIQPCKQGARKLVLATNIAETSLTIEGIDLVIDCGLEKVAIYNNASLLNKLVQKQIAKSSAIQRAGRAGRLMAGHCIRLYAKDDFERRPDQSINDIAQADLLPTLIEAARWGVAKLADLPLLELPSEIKEQQAWQELQSLAIVDKDNKLTAHGKKVAEFSCHPRFAHMILSACQLASTMRNDNLPLLACMLVALLEERDLLPNEQSRFDCDIAQRITLLVQKWHKPFGVIANIIKQVQNLTRGAQLKSIDSLAIKSIPTNCIGLLLAHAYPERIAKARGSIGDFICANGKGVTLEQQDALAGESYLVIADLIQTSHQLKVRLAAKIDVSQIEQAFSNQISTQELAIFDDVSGKIITRKRTSLAAINLKETVSNTNLSSNLIAKMWCDVLRRKGLRFLSWQQKDLALRARWQWLTRYFPHYQLPEISDEILVTNLAGWFSPFVGEIKSLTQLAKLDLSAMLLSQLDYQQQQLLKQAAPSVYIGSTGRHCAITYSQEKSPKVAMPMQELYGSVQTPCVGGINGHPGIPLLLELLSPAQRPIQVTQDLAKFWAGSYKAVQKDMKSQYPKHFWPDNPADAQPTNKTKRHLKNIS